MGGPAAGVRGITVAPADAAARGDADRGAASFLDEMANVANTANVANVVVRQVGHGANPANLANPANVANAGNVANNAASVGNPANVASPANGANGANGTNGVLRQVAVPPRRGAAALFWLALFATNSLGLKASGKGVWRAAARPENAFQVIE